MTLPRRNRRIFRTAVVPVPMAPAPKEPERFWNPADPSEPHVLVVYDGPGVGVALVPHNAPGTFVNAQDPRALAKAIHDFAKSFGEYHESIHALMDRDHEALVEKLEAKIEEVREERLSAMDDARKAEALLDRRDEALKDLHTRLSNLEDEINEKPLDAETLALRLQGLRERIREGQQDL